MASQPLSYVDAAEYLRRERLAETKHEYVDGDILDMAGGKPAHSLIAANVSGELRNRLRGTDCMAFNSDLRVCVQLGRLITYPDVSVVCGQPQYVDEERDTITNPRVIVEVLSPSTRNYDRGDKSLRYRMLPSLAEYLLIDQEPVDIEHYRRQSGGTWAVQRILEPTATIRLESINIDLPLSEIYAGVTAL
jgi:Uma2 family endonuclease